MIDKEKEISKVTIDNTSVPLYEKPTQNKTIIPTTQEQVINADAGYNLSSVTVEAVTSDIDSNILPTNIRQGITILGVDGNLAPDKPDQSKSVNPTTSQQVVVADTGYELAQVTVNAVTNDIDSNIIPENIKEGVTILGVEGNLKSGGGENKLPALVDGSITTLTAEDLAGATSIRQFAFYFCSSLTGITVPDSVTSIGSQAFSNCTSLTSAIIGDSVTSIGESAFYDCNSLTSVAIPDSVTSIGSSAFRNCSNLTNVYYAGDINDWVSIDFGNQYANPLYYADNLYLNGQTSTPYEFPSDLDLSNATKIGSYSLYNQTGITSVTIGDGVTSIGSYAFYGCSGLTEVTIPSSVTSIGSYAFGYCSSLTEVTIPDSVTSIGEYAFPSCSSLTSITIPDSVTSIGNSAFEWCSNLTSAIIGNSVTSIGKAAFYGCTGLQNITYQGQVPNIQSNTFANCTSITKYDFRNCTTVPTLANVTALGHASGCQIIIPDALYDTWTTSSVWSDLTDVTFVKASEYVE